MGCDYSNRHDVFKVVWVNAYVKISHDYFQMVQGIPYTEACSCTLGNMMSTYTHMRSYHMMSARYSELLSRLTCVQVLQVM
jgi:hypothetical protein